MKFKICYYPTNVTNTGYFVSEICTMIIPEIAYSTLSNKCPRCHQGKVFENNNPYASGMSKIKKECSECHLHYEKEPGFFYGSMYVSYALMAGIFITWFIIDLLFLQMDAVYLALIVMGSILSLSPVVFRWSRIIWLNFFVRYDKRLAKNLDAAKKSDVTGSVNSI